MTYTLKLIGNKEEINQARIILNIISNLQKATGKSTIECMKITAEVTRELKN